MESPDLGVEIMKERENVRVDEKKNQVTVVLDARFYSPESIKLSTGDFRDCCSTKLEFKNKGITVILSPNSKEIDINTIGYEFCNYVLGRMRLDGSRF